MLTACEAEAEDRQTSLERDSAGITIVESDRPAWRDDEVLTLSPDPVLVIGTEGGADYDLSGVAGAALLADGRIVIANGGTAQLRFYDSNGAFLSAAAGRGEGPGELPAMNRFERLDGDTLAVMSVEARSISLYDSHGAFLQRLQLGNIQLEIPGNAQILIPLAGRAYLIAVTNVEQQGRAIGEPWIQPVNLAVLAADSTVRELGSLPGPTLVMKAGFPANLLFSPVPAYAASGTSLFYGIGSEYSIRQYTFDGQLERLIRKRWLPSAVTSANMDEFVDRSIISDGPEAEIAKKEMRVSPYADAVPAFSHFHVDREDRLWVREANPGDASAGGFSSYPAQPRLWSVFDKGGRWLGDVTMPARFVPKDIGADYVLGIARDSLDIQTVVKYDLRGGRGDR